MVFDFFLVGVPTTFQVYPDVQRSEYEFYIQFYDGTKDDWKLVVQRYQETVRYTYLRYNMISGAGRKGSFVGFSLKFIGLYCTDTEKLLELFIAVYKQQLSEQFVIRYNDAKIPSFGVRDLLIVKDKIDLIREVFAYNLREHFAHDFAALDSSFVQANPSVICKMPSKYFNKELVEKLKRFSFIELSPTTVTEDVQMEEDGIPKRLSPADLALFSKLPGKVVLHASNLQLKWSDLQTHLNTLTLLDKNKRQEEKVYITREYNNLRRQLDLRLSIFKHEINLLEQQIKAYPNHPYLKEVSQMVNHVLETGESKLEILANSVKKIENVIQSIHNTGESKKGYRIGVIRYKKLLGAAVIIAFLSGILYYAWPGPIGDEPPTADTVSTRMDIAPGGSYGDPIPVSSETNTRKTEPEASNANNTAHQSKQRVNTTPATRPNKAATTPKIQTETKRKSTDETGSKRQKQVNF